MTYEVVSSETKFRGHVITVGVDGIRMPDGSVAQREIVRHPGAVGVAAVDDEDRIVLVRQYRVPIGDWMDELPAGLLDVDGESALDGAKRELWEEAGVRAEHWQVLLDLHTSPGMTDEAIRIYLARGLTDAAAEDRHTPSEEEIELTVHRVPLGEAVERVLRGELTNAACVAGVIAAAGARNAGWQGLRPAESPWPARPGR